MARTETTYWLKAKTGGSNERFENIGEQIDGEDAAWQAAGHLQGLGDDVAVVRSVTSRFSQGGFQVVSSLHGRLYAETR